MTEPLGMTVPCAGTGGWPVTNELDGHAHFSAMCTNILAGNVRAEALIPESLVVENDAAFLLVYGIAECLRAQEQPQKHVETGGR